LLAWNCLPGSVTVADIGRRGIGGPRRRAARCEQLLGSDPDRLAHSKAAAQRTEFLTLAVHPERAALLVAAAWLHDIGYAPGLRDTGFHPIDGACHLQAIGWPPAICHLVAHHSGTSPIPGDMQL
jgi:HD superfamily phosphodiesterase